VPGQFLVHDNAIPICAAELKPTLRAKRQVRETLTLVMISTRSRCGVDMTVGGGEEHLWMNRMDIGGFKTPWFINLQANLSQPRNTSSLSIPASTVLPIYVRSTRRIWKEYGHWIPMRISNLQYYSYYANIFD